MTTSLAPVPTATPHDHADEVKWVVDPTTPSKTKVKKNTKRYTHAEKGRVRTRNHTGVDRSTPDAAHAAAVRTAASEAREEARRIVGTLGEVTGGSPFAMPGTTISQPPRRSQPEESAAPTHADVTIDSIRTQRIKALALARLACGRNTEEDVADAAAALDLTPGHVRRLITEFINTASVRPPTDRAKITVPDLWRLKVEYFAANGNAALAYKFLSEEERGGMCLRTYQRYIHKEMDPALRAAARGGHRAMVKHQMFNREVVPHRAYAYSIDHTLLGVQMLPQRGSTPLWPWMTIVQDIQTGVVLAFKLSPATPNTQTTIDVLAEAIQGWTTDDGHFVGGKPLFLRSDRGGDFISEALANHLVNLEIDRQFTQPYSSWQNPVERTNGIVDREFSPQFPGFSAGGSDDYSRRVNRLPIDKKSLLTLEMAHLKYQRLFADLNTRRLKSRGGLSRLDAWIAQDADGYQPVRATKDEIVHAMSKRSEHKLHHYGIGARREFYKNPRLGELLRSGVETVEIRYHDSDLDHIEVFHDGAWICTARRYDKASDAGTVARRQAQDDEVRVLTSEAARQNSLRTVEELRATGRYEEHELPAVPEPLYTEDDSETQDEAEASDDAYARAYDGLGLSDTTVTDEATGLQVNSSTGEVCA